MDTSQKSVNCLTEPLLQLLHIHTLAWGSPRHNLHKISLQIKIKMVSLEGNS